jgi:hypothetical protein
MARFAAPDPGGRSYKRIAYALGTGWLQGANPSRCPAGKGTWHGSHVCRGSGTLEA